MIIRVLSAGGAEIASAREDAYVHLVLNDWAYEKAALSGWRSRRYRAITW